jgi:hypothetical protein
MAQTISATHIAATETAIFDELFKSIDSDVSEADQEKALNVAQHLTAVRQLVINHLGEVV